MPKIQEYLPENEAQGPVGQTSPMLEQVSMFGRGIEEAGRSITDAGNILHQRQTQAETSDAYASVAEQRANFMMRVQQETADGTLDVGKVKQEYQDWTEKQYDTYNTTGGKDAFTRASARAGGSLLQTAARGQAIVAGNKAKDNLSSLSNVNSNLVEKDPSQFADLHASQTEAIQAQVEAGALKQPEAEQIKKAMGIELAKGAVRGYMQSDYENIKASVIASGDKVDPNTVRLNTALSALNHGVFDEFLDSDHKEALRRELRGNQAAAQAAGKTAIGQRQAAVDAQGEVFKSDAYEKIRTGNFDPSSSVQAFRNGLITADEQLKLNHLSDESVKAQSATNPAVKNDLMRRVLLPDNDPQKISDPMQVAYMVGNGISHHDFADLTATIKMIPSNRVNSFNEAALQKVAAQRIGKDDPDSQYKLMMFNNEVMQAKQNALKAGEPIGPLFDPNSPKFLGNSVQKYVSTPQQIVQAQAARLTGQAFAPATVATQPGVTPTPGKPAPAGLFQQKPGEAERGARDWKEISDTAKGVWDSVFPASPKEADGIDFASRYNTDHKTKKSADIGANDIANMNMTALKNLNQNALSPDAKAAARARYNALYKASQGGK